MLFATWRKWLSIKQIERFDVLLPKQIYECIYVIALLLFIQDEAKLGDLFSVGL